MGFFRKALPILVCVAMLASMIGCGKSSETPPAATEAASAPAPAESTAQAPVENVDETPAEAPTEYRMLYESEYTSLNYLSIGNTYELKAAANAVDGLTEYSTLGVVEPALAESWSSNADNTVWTFNIRQGVKWVDVNGKEVAEVTAQDWVDAAKYVNDAHNDSSLQYMFDGIVKNASTYYGQTASVLDAENAVTDGEAATVEEYYTANDINPSTFIDFDEVGVKAVDTYTLEYTMEAPIPFFISVLSYASYLPVYGPFLEEMGENFGIDNESILYNGGYIMTEFEPNVRHAFEVNPLYWDKDELYIKKVSHIYNADYNTLAPSMLQRGEIDEALIGADILDDWLAGDATKDLVRPSMPVISYSYFFAFNFEPRIDAQYEPDNWIKAVNNENFRQALFHGLDRIKALTVKDPYNPQSLINNTVTPETFAVADGLDYTQYSPLKPLSDGDSFNEALALQYRDKAKEELTAAGATFPIKALMPYNPVTTNWDNECQVVEQQIEELLGKDFIDIIVEAGPSTGFLAAVRRAGAYSFMKCNWGADYADPQTWTDPFADGNSYNFMYTDPDKVMSDIAATSKSPETQAIVDEYYALVDVAKSSVTDAAARFEAFAKAEAFLINHAIIIPYSIDSDGYMSSTMDEFTKMFAPYGLAPYRWKGVQLLSAPMSMDAFNAAYEKWQADFTAAQAAAE
jgi:oligopeptide transport system substrate-binding protein